MQTVNVLPNNRGVPNQLQVPDQPVHVGGEGKIYFTIDSKYVVKIYHRPSPEKKAKLEHVLTLGRNLGEAERFLAWPLGIVNQLGNQSSLGVVTRFVPYDTLGKLAQYPWLAARQLKEGHNWLNYVKMARSVATAVATLHNKGIAHTDLSFKNFLADIKSGEVVLIDLDGVVVRGFLAPEVLGTPKFLAPELAMEVAKKRQAERAGKQYSRQVQPSQESDRHSAAVIILWTLLYRNVMAPVLCYDDEDAILDDALGYGQFACFSEDPHDRRNWFRDIGAPFIKQGYPSYRILTPRLQELTQEALVENLHNPGKRPPVREWEWALADSYDALAPCRACGQSLFYPYWVQPRLRRCPFCGAGHQPPLPSVVELLEEHQKGMHRVVRTAVFYHGLPLFTDVTIPGTRPPFTRRGTPIIGQVVWDSKEGVHRLVNNGDTPWRVIAGGSGTVGRGASVALRRGVLLSFGDGKRLARVVE